MKEAVHRWDDGRLGERDMGLHYVSLLGDAAEVVSLAGMGGVAGRQSRRILG